MRRVWLLPALLSLAPAEASAIDRPPPLPPTAAQVDVEEHLQRRLDKALPLVDHEGRRARLGDALTGLRPAVLVMAYYRCPMLCGLVLRGVVLAVNERRLSLGKDFDAVTVSVDPEDTPERAREKRASVTAALGLSGSAGWPFMMGREADVARLADDIGFRYAKDAKTGEYAHPAITVILTPDGRVSRYLYGVSPSARDLELALIEAGEGKIGGIVDRVIMTCYRWDPAARAYGPVVLGFVRIGGAMIAVTVALTLALLFKREAKGARRRGASA